MGEKPIQVNSEIGKLKTVILHRPGKELNMMLLRKLCEIMELKFYILINWRQNRFITMKLNGDLFRILFELQNRVNDI